MNKKKPFWDVEETKGFVYVAAKDGLEYKVWNQGSAESIQRVADILAKIREDINTLLIYLATNKDRWRDHPIAFGIYHTLNLHAPNCNEKVFYDINALNLINKLSGDDLFNYQEMTPNDEGILGLNKPKQVINVNFVYKGKKMDYELATKRSIFLTIRPQLSDNGNPDIFDTYKKILDLAIHELTHTTCNDTRWKTDNHRHPYPEYHKMMRQFARNCGVLK
jgi:hypothetical protein